MAHPPSTTGTLATLITSPRFNVQVYKIDIAKRLEVDSGSELTSEFLHSELHPVKSLNKPKFAKPAAPSRGARRITKAPPS